MRILQKLSTTVIMLLFLVVLILEFFIQPEYHFDDYPYFDHNIVLLIPSVIVVSAAMILLMKLGEKVSWNPVFPLVFFVAASAMILFLVPMKPVSDQKIVYELILNDLQDPDAYMGSNSNVIPTILYMYILTRVFGKSLWVIKTANVLCGFISLFLTSKIYGLLCADGGAGKNLFETGEKKMLWLAALFLPAFFYNNHIYNELPAVSLSLLMIYLVMRNDRLPLIRVVTVMVSILQFVLRQSGIVMVIACALYLFFYLKERKYAIVYALSVIVLFLLVTDLNLLIMGIDESQSYPIWSFIRMGMNEAEFGFQDSSHSVDVTFWDCVARYREYGLLKVLSIYAKKIFWFLGEGTYMSGRYGYGSPDNAYEYSTFITEAVSGSAYRPLRIWTNMVLRAQYMFYMFLALAGTYKARQRNEFSILFFAVVLFIGFYLIWEIKSRYLYGLYPIILILAMHGWESIVKFRAEHHRV